MVKGKKKKPTYEEIEYNNKYQPSKTIAKLIPKEKSLRKKKNISTNHHVKEDTTDDESMKPVNDKRT
jgi:hypothetical protein